jgi:3-deoxy-7-phosphoheptulonate synthase
MEQLPQTRPPQPEPSHPEPVQPEPAQGWTPSSWRSKAAEQQPRYSDTERHAQVLGQIARLPPLVTSWEVESLKAKLARAAAGELFVLQGGDCAESFEDCEAGPIAAQLKILLQMSLVLVHATQKPVVRIGRIAGQYAKPRSSDAETQNGVTLPSYRGDLVNRSGFSRGERDPDPELLLRGYERAGLTLNFVRALSSDGFADLHHPENWDIGFAEHSELRGEYERMVEGVRDSLRFMQAVSGQSAAELGRVDFYASHEGLVLPYEEAQTRRVPRREGWYNLSTHLPWIGMRTAALGGAHVEYFRGIQNPIGVKIGPSMTEPWLKSLLAALSPRGEPGRLTLIHRLGAEQIGAHLPRLIEAAGASVRNVAWVCDPMHGNTETTADGIKTRRFEKILAELEQAFEIHSRCGSHLAGVHFELTGDDVTECVGGARQLCEQDLGRAYRSKVDPRLNGEQALEMSMRIARHLRRR